MRFPTINDRFPKIRIADLIRASIAVFALTCALAGDVSSAVSAQAASSTSARHQAAPCTNAVPAILTVGDYAEVSAIPPAPLKVHANNKVSSAVISSLPIKTRFVVLLGPVCTAIAMGEDAPPGPGYNWYLVRTDGGLSGWIADGAIDDKTNAPTYFVDKLSDTPPAPPTWKMTSVAVDDQHSSSSDDYIYDVALWSPDNQKFAINLVDGQSKVIDLAGKILLESNSELYGWFGDGKVLAGTQYDPKSESGVDVYLWSDPLKTPTKIGHILGGNGHWSPDGKKYAVFHWRDQNATPRDIVVWDETGKSFTVTQNAYYFGGPYASVVNYLFAWSPKSDRIAYYVAQGDDSTSAITFSVQVSDLNGKVLNTYPFKSSGASVTIDSLGPLLWLPDGSIVASVVQDGGNGFVSGQGWNATGKTFSTMFTINALNFEAPNGQVLGELSMDNDFVLASRQLEESRTGLVAGIAWSPNGATMLGGYANGFAEWYASNGRLVTQIEAGFELPQGVVWSPDGKYLATGNQPKTLGSGNGNASDVLPNGKVLIYDATAKLVAVLDNANPPLAWSPDSKTLVSLSADYAALQIWKVGAK